VEGIAGGELRADLDPQLATLALLGLCNSVIANRALPRSSSIDDIIEEYARIVTGGVVVPASNKTVPFTGRPKRSTRRTPTRK